MATSCQSLADSRDAQVTPKSWETWMAADDATATSLDASPDIATDFHVRSVSPRLRHDQSDTTGFPNLDPAVTKPSRPRNTPADGSDDTVTATKAFVGESSGSANPQSESTNVYVAPAATVIVLSVPLGLLLSTLASSSKTDLPVGPLDRMTLTDCDDSDPKGANAEMRTQIVPVISVAGTVTLAWKFTPSDDTSQPEGAVTDKGAWKSTLLKAKDWASEGVPRRARKPLRLSGVTVIRGTSTVPLTDTVAGVAPALVSVTLPENAPAGDDATRRTNTVPFVVDVGTDTLPANAVPLVETSQPVEAVTVKASSRLAVPNVKDWAGEGVGFVAVNPLKETG